MEGRLLENIGRQIIFCSKLRSQAPTNSQRRVLGIAAAVVFVSGLATSTVTQSAISFSTRMVEDPNGIASVLVRHSYGEGSTERNTSDPGAMSISGEWSRIT